MKKRLTAVICAVLSLMTLCAVFTAGCDFGSSTPKEYTVQYTDGDELRSLTVKEGLLYSIEYIPARTGYEFLGLFDAENGGTQYVNASGTSVSPLSGDNKNIILYPQWKAKEYTVVLEFQGGEVSGNRQMKASYGSSLPELPVNVVKEHSVFSGWYTKENGAGVLVADKNGLVPVVSVVNESNFNLNSEYIYLYAGFNTAKYTVTLNFGGAAPAETVEVEYNTPVTALVYNARNDNGEAVLSWSESANGTTAFTGNITGNKTLYAAEWAPAIEFNANGGEKIAPVVARAGATVSLPSPERDLYKFMYWENGNGEKYTATVMPVESVTLNAVWQAKLVFDENGGSEVNDISAAANTKITLPSPEKDGYIFAGWYTADKERYTSTSMPSAGIALKAGWYKEKVGEKVTVTGSTRIQLDSSKITAPALNKFCIEIDVSKYTADGPVTIKFDTQGHYYCQDGPATINANFYSRKVINDSYLMTIESFAAKDSTDTVFNFNKIFTVDQNFYICFWQTKSGPWGSWITDFYYTITYPDTSTLYL